MANIFERLREERARLGLSQQAMADLGGVQRRAQTRYESGERCPDGLYLSAVAEGGVDVLYVLTGQRAVSTTYPSIMQSAPMGIGEAHTPDERELLINWQALTEQQRREIKLLILDRIEMNELKAEVAALKKTRTEKVSRETTKLSPKPQNGDIAEAKGSKLGRGR